jgi:indolepyruvate decarboxylase
MADPTLRPIVIVGDGAFQMTGMELATVARNKLNPIVILLNNGIYLTEQLILSGSFNDLLPWNYYQLPEVIGSGKGFLVKTEEQLDHALELAAKYIDGFSIIDVRLGRTDSSAAIQRMTGQMSMKAGTDHSKPQERSNFGSRLQ